MIALLRDFDVVLTVDNFIMHAAHLCGVPAVVLWGPTDHRVYGYAEQTHLQGHSSCEHPDGCIGAGRGHLYPTPCPLGEDGCVNRMDIERTLSATRAILDGRCGPRDRE